MEGEGGGNCGEDKGRKIEEVVGRDEGGAGGEKEKWGLPNMGRRVQ